MINAMYFFSVIMISASITLLDSAIKKVKN